MSDDKTLLSIISLVSDDNPVSSFREAHTEQEGTTTKCIFSEKRR